MMVMEISIWLQMATAYSTIIGKGMPVILEMLLLEVLPCLSLVGGQRRSQHESASISVHVFERMMREIH